MRRWYASSGTARTAAGRGTYYTWDSRLSETESDYEQHGQCRPPRRCNWVDRQGVSSAVNRPTVYIVVSGDTLSGIAARNGVSLSALLAANPQIRTPTAFTPATGSPFRRTRRSKNHAPAAWFLRTPTGALVYYCINEPIQLRVRSAR